MYAYDTGESSTAYMRMGFEYNGCDQLASTRLLSGAKLVVTITLTLSSTGPRQKPLNTPWLAAIQLAPGAVTFCAPARSSYRAAYSGAASRSRRNSTSAAALTCTWHAICEECQ